MPPFHDTRFWCSDWSLDKSLNVDRFVVDVDTSMSTEMSFFCVQFLNVECDRALQNSLRYFSHFPRLKGEKKLCLQYILSKKTCIWN